MKVALVYDRVNKWGGAERVLLALNELFPDAPLYTSVYNPSSAPWAKIFPKVITSFLQRFPYARDNHEQLPYLMPLVFESFNFSEYDLVISVTSEAAKGIITKSGTLHVCFMLTPTRYLWSLYDFYFKKQPFKALSKPIISYLRRWDAIAAQRPDIIISQSTEVKNRIKRYYGRDSELIFSPVEVGKFKTQNSRLKKNIQKTKDKDFYLLVSRLIPYKRADLAIEAFNELNLTLLIVGTGTEEKRLKKMAKRNIKFTGELTDGELAGYYQKARALIFPQEEDFGLVVLEANAAGTPVIAYNKGGALDTVVLWKTGIFFDKQEKQSLISAVKKFEGLKFDKKRLVKHAEKFSKEIFKEKFKSLIEDARK